MRRAKTNVFSVIQQQNEVAYICGHVQIVQRGDKRHREVVDQLQKLSVLVKGLFAPIFGPPG